jgi:O-antigen ligase
MRVMTRSAAHPNAGFAPALPAAFRSISPYLVPTLIALTATAGARAHELIPLAPKIRPVLLLTYIVTPLLLLGVRPSLMREATRTPLFRVFTMFVVWAALGVPFAVFPSAALKNLQLFLPAFAIILLTLLAPPLKATLDRLQAGFTIACTITGGLAIALAGGSADRLGTSGSLDANDLAAVMAMAVPLALGLATRARGIAKLWWLGTMSILLAVYAGTGSRGGTIAIVVGSIVFVLGQGGSRRITYALLCIVAGAVTWTFAPATLRTRVTSFIEGQSDYNETDYTGRKAVWARARGYIAERPVFGVGLNNFPFMEGETCKRLFPGQGCKWSATHNSYLQAAADLGVPGGALFVALLSVGFINGYAVWRPRRGNPKDPLHRPELLASLVGFAAAATFLSLAYFHLTFALIALITLARRTRALAAGETATLPLPAQGPAAPAFPAPTGRVGPFGVQPRRRGGLATGRFHSGA